MRRSTFIAALLACLVAGCYGRRGDGGALRLAPGEFGLVSGHPTVLVFGAAWCKPCRHEVPLFNALLGRFPGKVDVRGFLVEGTAPGSLPDAAALAEFADAHGDHPGYPLAADADWTRFMELRPPLGHQLPLVAFVAADGTVQSVVQHSLDFEGDLVPLTRVLVDGAPPVPPPAARQPPPALRWEALATWLAAAGHEVDSSSYEAVHAGWVAGLEAQGFNAREMAFETGSLALAAGDVPSEGHWTALTGCELTVEFAEDGSVASTSGVCH